MKQRALRSGKGQEAESFRFDNNRGPKRMRFFSQLAHDWEYEGEDVHLGSEAITVYAM